ncbi:MAG: hypothetical protein KAV82_14265 [Phycisphaerae bacterium]|nr:hypothetical protein [Phycisphaerae bacterium]
MGSDADGDDLTMPTFFGRKYERKGVPTTETIVGVVVLLVLVGIVAAVVTVSTRPQTPLFELPPGVERESQPSRPQWIAEHMMPGFGTAGWARQDTPEILGRPALQAAGEAELLEAGAVWVYRGVYANPASGEKVSVEIVDTDTPANAAGLYQQRKPHDTSPLAVGNAGWQNTQKGAFWAGRYYTEFDRSGVQAAEPSVRTIADALGSVQIVYETPLEAESALPEEVPPFPEIDAAGWEVPTAPREYTPLNLWEKIDGRAELYLQFDMQRMTFGTYHHRTDPGLSFGVYWYEMASPDGAFGIYEAESGGRVTEIEVGNAGYGVAGSVFFWKGNCYVRLEADGEDEALEAIGLAIARAIAGRIEDTGKELWADALLPSEGRAGNELAYHGANAFSLDFLSAVFSADYVHQGKTFTMFVHRAQEEPEAAKLLEAYAAFFNEYGQLLQHNRVDEIDFVVGESGGIVDAVFVVGVYLGGVSNCEDVTFAREQALSFARAIATQSQAETRENGKWKIEN